MKSVIWMISLGSGTSGGVLAPLLMLGAALGGVASLFLPSFGAGFWPLVAMGAILGATMGAPFTGIIFSLELTHDFNMLLPLTIATFFAYGFTVLTLKRSILTEKIARRGYHLSREYSVDPLEILFVREVMRTNIAALPAESTVEDARELVRPATRIHGQHVFPILDKQKHIVGVVSRNHLLKLFEEADPVVARRRLDEIASGRPTTAFEDEPLRQVVNRMAESGFTRLPVVDRKNSRCLLGMVSLEDLLHARGRNLEEERSRERVLRLRLPLGRRVVKVNP